MFSERALKLSLPTKYESKVNIIYLLFQDLFCLGDPLK